MIETGIFIFGFDVGHILEALLAVVGAFVVAGKAIAPFTATDKDDKFFDKIGGWVDTARGFFTKKDKEIK